MTAIRKNQLYVIPYPEARASLRESFDAVLAALPPEDSGPAGCRETQAAISRYVQDRLERQEREKRV
jgi:hypothetical protein